MPVYHDYYVEALANLVAEKRLMINKRITKTHTKVIRRDQVRLPMFTLYEDEELWSELLMMWGLAE